MNKNYAIAIGINQYDFNKSLKYASRDAELISSFLSKKCKFDKTFLFSDNSPKINNKSTFPSRSNLLYLLRTLFSTPVLEENDSFWFFFSGHGIRVEQCDYLIPSDGDPDNAKETTISVATIITYLRKSGAGNIVLIMDACRSEGPSADSKGVGFGSQSQNIRKDVSVVSIFSCKPNERSYEIDDLKQGAFTNAIIDTLESNKTNLHRTIRNLDLCLRDKLLEINNKYGKPSQTPYIFVEPIWKTDILLLPQIASDEEIKNQENSANKAETKGDFSLALCLWEQIASNKYSSESVDAILRIRTKIKERFSGKNTTSKTSSKEEPSKGTSSEFKESLSPKNSYKDVSEDVSEEKTIIRDLQNNIPLKNTKSIEIPSESSSKFIVHEEFSEIVTPKKILLIFLQSPDDYNVDLYSHDTARQIEESLIRNSKFREYFSIDLHIIDNRADFFSSMKEKLGKDFFYCLQ